jgi:hypothetical protein
MKSRIAVVNFLGVVGLVFASRSAFAQLNITAQNGQVWAINAVEGTLTGSTNSAVPNAFDHYGVLSLRQNTGAVFTPDGFGLTLNGTGRRADTTTTWTTASVSGLNSGDTINGLSVTRRLDAPTGTNYIRYIDSFSNTGSTALSGLQVGWGAMLDIGGYTSVFGNLGSDEATTLANTSSGDTSLTTADTWSIITDSGVAAGTPPSSFDPNVASFDPPAGVIFRDAGGLISGFGDGTNGSPFATAWPGNGNDGLTYLYNFDLAAGQTAYIAHFVYTGTPNTTKTTVEGDLNSWNYNTAFSDLTAPDLARLLNFAGATIPEPGTMGLLAGALGALPLLRRRKRTY